MTPWERFQRDWKDKRVLIMGLGLQGRGVGDARVFAEAGARVTVTDLKSESELSESLKKLAPYNPSTHRDPSVGIAQDVAQRAGLHIRFVLGRHDEEDFKTADTIIRNPAVPKESPYLKIARNAGVSIKMDSSLFATYCPLPIVGITGTRGKTTTTMMIYEVLKAHGREGSDLAERSDPLRSVFLGGNVSGRATLELLREVSQVTLAPRVPRASRQNGSDLAERSDPSGTNPSGIVVLELSSWELEGWEDEKISPHIAAFTNFSEDHLNRYSSMEEYFQDKLPITNHQSPSDWLVVNRDNEWTRKAAALTKAQIKWFSVNDLPNGFQLSIPGDHNRANAAAALAVAEILSIDRESALETLCTFRGVPGRLETIAEIDGVTYVNDTTATTPTATIAALRAIDKPIVLIAGGSSKKLDLRPLVEAISKYVKQVVFLKGDGTEEMIRSFASLDSSARRRLLAQNDVMQDTAIARFDDLREAVERAKQLAHPGDAVLLSPGCASFSMFKNEFDRGEQFNQIVRTWQKRR